MADSQTQPVPQDETQSGFVHELQKGLLNDLITAVESTEMTIPQMREAAKFILEKTRHMENEADVASFLKELTERWPAFTITQTVFGGKAVVEKEQQVIDKLSAYIKTMDSSQ